MFSVFMGLVKRVGIFVIIGQTILHFGISKKYEKYMKLVMSFMIGAQIVFAFGVYWGQEGEEIHVISPEEYFEAWECNMEEMEKTIEKYEVTMIENAKRKKKEETSSNMGHENWGTNRIEIEKIVIR